MKILTAQSEEQINLLMKEVFEEGGFDVEIANDGKECLDKMINNKYDAVLLNSMIPVIDGYTVVEKFKKSGKPQGKIIITSNLSSDIPIEEAFERGVDGYEVLTRIKFDELVDIIKNYISGTITKEESKQKALGKWRKKRLKQIKKRYNPIIQSRKLRIPEGRKVVLSNTRITNFLRFIRNNDKDLGMSVKLVNENLDDDKTFKEIFKIHNIDGKSKYGFFLATEELAENKYKIEFGFVAAPLAGDGGTWIVEFDLKDSVTKCDKVDEWIS